MTELTNEEKQAMEKIAILMKPVDQRRIEMLTLKAVGIPNSNIVQTLSQKYSVTPKAIYEDWRKRGKWAPKLIDMDNSEGMIADLVVFLKWLQKRAVKEILDGDNSNARIGGIKIAAETARFIYEVAKNTGKIRTVPEQIEIVKREDEVDLRTFTAEEREEIRQLNRRMLDARRAGAP